MDDIQHNISGISIQGRKVNNLRYADDIDLIETSEQELQNIIENIHMGGTGAGLKINIQKSKVVVMAQMRLM